MEVRSSSQCKAASLFALLYKVQINRSQVKDLRKVLLICGLGVSVNGNVRVLVGSVVFCCFGFLLFYGKLVLLCIQNVVFCFFFNRKCVLDSYFSIAT